MAKRKSIVDQFAEIGKEMADAINTFFDGDVFDSDSSEETTTEEKVNDGTEGKPKQRKPANTFKPASPGKKGAEVVPGNGGSGRNKPGAIPGKEEKPDGESEESESEESEPGTDNK